MGNPMNEKTEESRSIGVLYAKLFAKKELFSWNLRIIDERCPELELLLREVEDMIKDIENLLVDRLPIRRFHAPRFHARFIDPYS